MNGEWIMTTSGVFQYYPDASEKRVKEQAYAIAIYWSTLQDSNTAFFYTGAPMYVSASTKEEIPPSVTNIEEAKVWALAVWRML